MGFTSFTLLPFSEGRFEAHAIDHNSPALSVIWYFHGANVAYIISVQLFKLYTCIFVFCCLYCPVFSLYKASISILPLFLICMVHLICLFIFVFMCEFVTSAALGISVFVFFLVHMIPTFWFLSSARICIMLIIPPNLISWWTWLLFGVHLWFCAACGLRSP